MPVNKELGDSLNGLEAYDKLDKLVEQESKKPIGDLHCPKCGSSRLYYFIGFKAGQIFVCKDCGYQGPLVIEDGELAGEIRGRWIEKRKSER